MSYLLFFCWAAFGAFIAGATEEPGPRAGREWRIFWFALLGPLVLVAALGYGYAQQKDAFRRR